MKTFREIAEMHYASEPNNEFAKQYRENRINALEKLLTEQLRIHDVSGMLKSFVSYAESRSISDINITDDTIEYFIEDFNLH